MRVRAYTKSNGPRRLVASQALKFERVGRSLKLSPRAESLAPVFIGKGVELVGSLGVTRAEPLRQDLVFSRLRGPAVTRPLRSIADEVRSQSLIRSLVDSQEGVCES